MRHFDAALDGSADYVWQAGTLNGNPIAAVAGLATLAELRKPGAYAQALRHRHSACATGWPPLAPQARACRRR